MDEYAILLVDDERQILSSLKRLLRKEPYRIFTAESGAEGLAVLQKEAIQLILSDQRMPQMTGTELLQKAREISPNTIRVMLSGYAEPEAILGSINEGGVFRFIAKPWNDDELKTTIRQCLEHYAVVQENKRLSRESEKHVAQLEALNRLLQSSVEIGTRSLQFSQEVLENLPVSVLGVSQDEEIMLTNETARTRFSGLQCLVPGADMTDVLPEEAVVAIRNCIQSSECEVFDFVWEDHSYQARPRKLGNDTEPRGLVLLIEEKDPCPQ